MTAAQAESYPTKNVRVVVPFAAAGPTDVIARIVGQKLAELYGHAFTIENVPGAGGNTGTAQVAKAPADGYTLLVVSHRLHGQPEPLRPGALRSGQGVRAGHAGRASPNVLVVNPEVPAKSVKELIALIKANPGKYSYAQPALGSTPHLGGELFKLTFNLDLAMVPFPGAAPAITSTIGGHTPIAFTALPPAITAAKEGKVRALAVMAEKRVARAAGRADHGGGRRARPGGRYADRHRRAGRHAERDRRSAAARHRQDRRRSRTSRKSSTRSASGRSPTRRRSSARRSRSRWRNGARWSAPPS